MTLVVKSCADEGRDPIISEITISIVEFSSLLIVVISAESLGVSPTLLRLLLLFNL